MTTGTSTTSRQEILEFYRRPGFMTSPGACAGRLDDLPRDIPGLVHALHGLILHEHIAPAYGVELSDERRAEVHIRSNEDRLQCLIARDDRPLTVAREPGERLIGDCRHYTVLFVAALRARGIPARARCGFGAYFEPGKFIDHWVGEYWNSARERWVMVDAQIDEVQRDLFEPDFDLLDVPRDRFLVAGDAWRMCRSGKADASKFGVMDMAGLWFIAGNVVRDVAALNNMEMLPWDVWGAMPQPGEDITPDRLAYFDRLAELTHDADAGFTQLRRMYEEDAGVSVPSTVFNAVRNQPEQI